MARIREHSPIVQVGIRSVDGSELRYLDPDRVFWAHEISDRRNLSWIDEAVDRLPDSVYVTIDMDGLDPSIAPGVGTPEPDGLTWRETTELLRTVCYERQVVAADIVEVRPIPPNHITEFLAAKLAYKIVAYTQQ